MALKILYVNIGADTIYTDNLLLVCRHHPSSCVLKMRRILTSGENFVFEKSMRLRCVMIGVLLSWHLHAHVCF